MIQEGGHRLRAELRGVALAMEQDEAPDPLHVGVFRPPTAMPHAQRLAKPVEKPSRPELGGAGHRRLRSRRPGAFVVPSTTYGNSLSIQSSVVPTVRSGPPRFLGEKCDASNLSSPPVPTIRSR